jgi:RNA polymerase sigma-70 factor (ECF subfamily)
LSGEDDGVFRFLLDEVGPPALRRLSRKHGGRLNSHDLDDVLMLAVEQLWRHRGRFDSARGSLRAWFWRIAMNSARDLLRRQARRLETSVDPSLLALLPAARSDAEESDRTDGECSSEGRVARWMLSGLPEAHRRILLADAASAEGAASARLLAEELGIRPATVRAYRSRARARVRALRRKPK